MCECCGGDCKLCEIRPLKPMPMNDIIGKKCQMIEDYYKACSGATEDLLGKDMEKDNVIKTMLARIQDIGRAQQALYRVLQDDIFDILSKHDPYWHSEHEKEADKLDDIRMKLGCFSDNLWDVYRILNTEDEDE